MKRYLSLAALFIAVLARANASEIAVIDDPDPADYHLNEGERLIMVVPSIDATSRYVPPEQAFGGAPRTPMPQQPVMQPRPPQRMERVARATEVAVDDAQSEVANQTFRRTRNEKEDITAADEPIPWWKGGLWRNRSNDEPEPENDRAAARSGDTPPPNRIRRLGFGPADDEPPPAAARSRDRYEDDPVAARRDSRGSYDDEENMWDNPEDYRDDYRASANEFDPYAQPQGGAQGNYPPQQGGFDPYAQPYPQQQYAQPYPPYPPQQQGYADPYATPYAQAPYGQQPYGVDPYAQQQPGISPPFTDPNAPLGAYLDSAYGSVPAIDAATGQPIMQPPAAYAQQPYPPVPPVAADPYAQPYAPPAPYGGYGTTGFVTGGMPPPPADTFGALPAEAPSPAAYNPAPAYDAQSGPQFENAVRMVKENRFTEAKAILASEVQRNPANAAAWRWLADCHYNLLELDDAIRAYQRSLDQDHSDYYALRGQGFSYLHRGHEYWRRMQEEVAQNRKEAAASTFALAHDDYKKALEMLGLCLRRAPNDGEAIYGEAMAAEGASRKLYSNAISYLKLGPEQRERAELFAENCLTVINKGIEQSRARSAQVPGDSGPRALLGGLYLRKATLYHQLNKNDLALIELRNARDAQRSILDEIDKNNATAQRAVAEIESLWDQWGGNNS